MVTGVGRVPSSDDPPVGLDGDCGGNVLATEKTRGHFAVAAEGGVERAVRVVAGEGKVIVAVERAVVIIGCSRNDDPRPVIAGSRVGLDGNRQGSLMVAPEAGADLAVA